MILKKYIWFLLWIGWNMCCPVMGNVQFNQTKDKEIPVLCKYYNDFLDLDELEKRL